LQKNRAGRWGKTGNTGIAGFGPAAVQALDQPAAGDSGNPDIPLRPGAFNRMPRDGVGSGRLGGQGPRIGRDLGLILHCVISRRVWASLIFCQPAFPLDGGVATVV
jgi:hypothetical protein